MENFNTGLLLSTIGMLTTFGALGLLYVTIVLLRRLLSSPVSSDVHDERLAPATATASPSSDTEKEAVAAAVGVRALLAATPAGNGQLGARLQQPPGRWWSQQGSTGPRSRARRYPYD